ncbi:Hypothetical Protein SLY_0672 [Strawberry lethal yellows phytoplasma (CPA) str. NZSb11]|uniref:Uncharacterized protein n=1 Tax=Strawberry lethal yellows phytoplasma (CPA) str. NZSb11 TaxID=980422 RepID=R4S1E5_PHYAS|nr:Hypothetical Protein SLY_0672 [Strawberry lethal yellows phytoplasma (CPA) str. NZSb11]
MFNVFFGFSFCSKMNKILKIVKQFFHFIKLFFILKRYENI